MKFQTRLYVGFGLVLFIACVISAVVITTLYRMNSDMEDIVQDKYVKVRLATEFRNEFVQLDRQIYDLLLQREHTSRQIDEVSEVIARTSAKSSDMMMQIRERITNPEVQEIYLKIYSSYHSYYNYLDQLIVLLRENRPEEAMQILHQDLGAISRQLDQDILTFKSLQEQEMESTLSGASRQFETFAAITFGLVAALLLCSLAIALWSVQRLRSSLQSVVSVLSTVMHSDHGALPRITVEANDEIGQIAQAFNHLAGSLEERTKEQSRHAEELTNQHWIKSMVAEVTQGYQGMEDTTSLAQWFITKVTPLVGAAYGVFYIRRVDALVKAASYAGDGEMIGKPFIRLGEGLVGQCAQEQIRMIIDDPPADYIRIKSGIGEAPPRQIVILPFTYKDKTEGVVELASFQPLSERSLTLLYELIDSLGLTISSIAGHMQVQALLKEAQVFTEELQTQSEELQQQQEELTTLNEQLGEQYRQTEQRNKQLEKLKYDLEMTNEQLRQASRYKSEFLANISHELRTPLNSILVLSQILVENAEEKLSDKQLEYVQTIHSSGNELLKLINEILDLSKIESGKMSVIAEDVQLKVILNEMMQHFKVAAEKKDIAFHVELDGSLEHEVLYTDGQKLQQILRNLLSNAMKFTDRGSVKLNVFPLSGDKAAELELGFGTNDWIAFEVQDTGIGIPEEKIDLIFESFLQADGTTSRKYGGTGLGLAISKQLAELLKGTIRVTSELGRGSTFTLYLMKTERAAAEAAASQMSSAVQVMDAEDHDGESGDAMSIHAHIKDRKILLVDDDMRNIYSLTSALEKYDLNVIFAENGVEGLRMLDEHPDTDLVLMDIMMPKMDGYETIRSIRQQARFAELPIIALTAKAMKEDRDKCMEAGANDYISKPVNIRQLMSLIQVWLSG